MNTHTRRLAAVALAAAACAIAIGLGQLAAWETSTVASNYVFDGAFPKPHATSAGRAA